ncbi:40S ribosomal protein S2 [Myotis davidii]|uniref:40S ribosomal protein S2 n=1 Tax=Myotis davidii TaxID=225400 RepID=L5M650_MYODS|nr:40S ribosomal protein S2 [Myotis davidii]
MQKDQGWQQVRVLVVPNERSLDIQRAAQESHPSPSNNGTRNKLLLLLPENTKWQVTWVLQGGEGEGEMLQGLPWRMGSSMHPGPVSVLRTGEELKAEDKEWIPVTKLGLLVKDMKIKSLKEICLFFLTIKNSEVIDFVLGASLRMRF